MRRTVFVLLVATTAIMTAALVNTGCDVEREVYDFDDNAELQAYIHQEPRAKELFRLDGLFPSGAYTKPGDTDGVYRDFIDSTHRRIYIEGEADADFLEPYGIVSYAEVFVVDQFRIGTERITDQRVDTLSPYEWRTLNRAGFFLQLGNPQDQAFSGWVLHGFNGGTPRKGTMVAEDDEGESFRLDALDYDRYRYIVNVKRLIIDTLPGPDSSSQWIDTNEVWQQVPRYSEEEYISLSDISQQRAGDTLLISGDGMDGGSSESGTVYTLMTTERNNGWTVERMSHPTPQTYRDTLVVPASSNDHYHLIMFQERRYPDRYGAIWVAPYRYIR